MVLVDISDEGDLLSDEYFSELSSISTDVMDKMANRVIKLKDGKIASIRNDLHPLHAEELSW